MFTTAFHRLAPGYRVAITSSLVQQGLTGVLCLGIDDVNVMWLACALAYWVGFYIIHRRRPATPSTTDILVIRFGFIPLLIVAYGLFYII